MASQISSFATEEDGDVDVPPVGVLSIKLA